ncbi:MAG: hypothetical protein ACRDZ1_07385 [Acidimicrobiia bacterium]
MSTATAMRHRFETFAGAASDLVARHPVVVANPYTRWFAGGEATREDVRHLAVQFSVFSHLFVEAQLRKVINAADPDAYRAGKEILLNELGVVFRPVRQDAPGAAGAPGDEATDPALVGTQGTVDGGTFRFAAAHFEWLLKFAEPLGLGFTELGKRRHGTTSTLFFCDELMRLYGSDDPSTAEGASFGVEHWAAAGFWKELIAGLRAFKARQCPDLPLGFWTFHDQLEDQHAAHTEDELREAVTTPGFDEARFLRGAVEMLDGVHAFWQGLDDDRRTGRAP